MSRKPPAIPLFGDAYLADTTHLTTEEHGAYLLLIMAAWRQDDCALPVDDRKLARVAGLSPRKWGAIKSTIMEFWTVEGGRMFQARLRKERAYVDQKSESNRKNAVARWGAQIIENKQTTPMPPQCQSDAPSPSPSPRRKEPKGSCASGDAPAVKPEHIFERWNQTAAAIGKPRVRDLTPERRQLLKARIAQYSLDDFLSVFAKIEASPFLRGDTGWKGGNFDWVFKKGNFQKIIEGNYDG